MKEIELTKFLEQTFLNHVRGIENAKVQMNKELKILFESKGIEMPQEFSFEIKDGKLIY